MKLCGDPKLKASFPEMLNNIPELNHCVLPISKDVGGGGRREVMIEYNAKCTSRGSRFQIVLNMTDRASISTTERTGAAADRGFSEGHATKVIKGNVFNELIE